MTAETVLQTSAAVSDTAGRMRISAPWLRASFGRTVAVKDHVRKVAGIPVVHTFPRTDTVVVRFSPQRIGRNELLAALASGDRTDQLARRSLNRGIRCFGATSLRGVERILMLTRS